MPKTPDSSDALSSFLDMAEGAMDALENIGNASGEAVCPTCGSSGFTLIASCICGWAHPVCLACVQAGAPITLRKLSREEFTEHERTCPEFSRAVNVASEKLDSAIEVKAK